jgi:hypothetical protein
MRHVGSVFGLVATVLALWVVAASGQQNPRITIRIDFPTGETRELPPLPAPNSGHIQFLWEGSYRDFYHWWSILDRDAGRVRFTIRAGRERDSELLDEIDVTMGELAVQTNTSPPLGFAVLRIEK